MDKIKVNLLAITPVQAVIYGGMLAGAMAWSGKWDLKSSLYAWGIGVGTGAVHAVIYGDLQDKARRLFGIRPAIAKKDSIVQYKVKN